MTRARHTVSLSINIFPSEAPGVGFFQKRFLSFASSIAVDWAVLVLRRLRFNLDRGFRFLRSWLPPFMVERVPAEHRRLWSVVLLVKARSDRPQSCVWQKTAQISRGAASGASSPFPPSVPPMRHPRRVRFNPMRVRTSSYECRAIRLVPARRHRLRTRHFPFTAPFEPSLDPTRC